MKRGIALIILTLNVLIWCNSLLGAESPAHNKDLATKEDIRMLMKLLEETKDSLNKRIDDTNRRIDDTNRRIDDLRSTMLWLFGTFISIALLLFGFIIRTLWVLSNRSKGIERAYETQRDEIDFLKALVEKLIVKA
jgi:hypothetical protein